jgi:hypothetical protein
MVVRVVIMGSRVGLVLTYGCHGEGGGDCALEVIGFFV